MFKVPVKEEVSPESREVFDSFEKTLGKVPNLYAMIGYSGVALSSYIAFVRAQAKGAFHGKEREAIFLIVSQLNGCEYCLASHTASAMKFGWKEEETLAIRRGDFSEQKWQVIYQVIASVISNKGEVNDPLLESFFALGYDQAALMDLMTLISVMSYTNYAYRLTKIPIDYPLAKAI